jgi:hypothetical protein
MSIAATPVQYTDNIDRLIYSPEFTAMDETERLGLIAAILDQMGVKEHRADHVVKRASIEVELAKL